MSIWSPEREERLKKLHAQQWSFTQIAIYLGVSRNSVAGKVDRLGLPKRVDPTAHKLQGKIDGKKARHGRSHGKAFQLFFTRPPSKAFVKAAAAKGCSSPDAPPPLNLSLIENNGCMWPTEKGFCGHPKAGHKHRPHYCEAHVRA